MATNKLDGVPNADCRFGWKIHEVAMAAIQEVNAEAEEHMTWMQEVLAEAIKTMSTPEVQLLPKTPSAKRARRMRGGRRSKAPDTEDDESSSAKPSRSGRGKNSKLQKSQDTSQNESEASTYDSQDADDEEGSTTRSGRPARKCRQTRTASTRSAGSKSGRTTRGKAKKQAEEEEEDGEDEVITNTAESGPVQSLFTNSATGLEKDDSPSDGLRRSCRLSNRLPTVAEDKDSLTKPCSVSVEDVTKTPEFAKDLEVKVQSAAKVSIKKDHNMNNEIQRNASKVNTPQSGKKGKGLNPNKNSPFAKAIPGYNRLNIKDRAKAYEEHVRNSGGSKSLVQRDSESSSGDEEAHIHTPKRAREESHVSETPTNATDKENPVTPPTVKRNSHGTAMETEDETTPTSGAIAEEVIEEELNSIEEEVESKRKSARRSSVQRSSRARKSRVSGVRQSLSKRRSSIMRHKLRRSSAVATAKNMLLKRLGVTESPRTHDGDSQDEPPVRTTRSKMRQHKQDTQVVSHMQPTASTRSKLRLKKSQTESHTPNHTASVRDTGSGPSSNAPNMNTRFHMRKNQQEATASPYTNLHSSSSKRPLTSSGEKHKNSPPKRQCLDSHDGSPRHGAKILTQEEIEARDRVATPENHKSIRGGGLHASSFLNKLKKTPTIGTPSSGGNVFSFIKRTTPQKSRTHKEIAELKRKELEAKEKKSESLIQKRNEMLHKRTEEQRKRREERQQQAARRREEQLRQERKLKQGIDKKHEEKRQLTAKIMEEKIKEEREKQKLREKRLAEAEEKRKQEEEARLKKLKEQEEEARLHEELMARKREFEEQERQARIAEQRRLAEERQAQLEREREQEAERLRALEEQKRKEEAERQREKEERERKERAERERQELERIREREKLRQIEIERQKEAERERVRAQQEAERIRKEQERKEQQEAKQTLALINKHNETLNTSTQSTKPAGQNLNCTFEKGAANTKKDDSQSDSYDMTPVRKVYKPSTSDNYDIGDLKSDDSTDDEDRPRKKIPDWAQGNPLKIQLIHQHYQPPDLDRIFPVIEMPDLNKMFSKRKARFNKRTSSAVWLSPMYKPSGKPMVPEDEEEDS